MIDHREVRDRRRREYADGDRVEVVRVAQDGGHDDSPSLPVGLRGTVHAPGGGPVTDDMGSLSVRWDNGSTLSALAEDEVRKVAPADERRIPHEREFTASESRLIESSPFGQRIVVRAMVGRSLNWRVARRLRDGSLELDYRHSASLDDPPTDRLIVAPDGRVYQGEVNLD